MTRRQFAVPLALLVVLLATLACNAGVATPTPGFSALQTMVASTLAAPSSQATMQVTPFPTYAIPSVIPSITSGPAATYAPPTYTYPTYAPPTYAPPPATTVSLPPATRFEFVVGSTEIVTTGTIPPGQKNTYVVRALQGQPTIVTLDSPNHDLTLSIFGANGAVLLPPSAGTSNWQGTLPSTQDYYFQVIGSSATENFTLNVIIAARIQFAPGAIKAVLNGTTVSGYAVTYAAYAQKGQKMDVILDVPGDSAGLTIWGFSDGQPYARAQNGVQDFSLVLPRTQDYIIEVVPRAGGVVNYSLTVKIK